MLKFECVGFKELHKNGRTFYIVHGVSQTMDDVPNDLYGLMVYSGFVSSEHLTKNNIDVSTLIGSTFRRYAIKQDDGTYKQGITFKKGD